MKPLITVVVPVYNVEKYLAKCIESLINQTYSNLEIILVDDGSNDLCGKICDEYERKDNRIKVIHKTNGGLSSARNYGINYMTGDYLAFVDSDDWIEPNMIETMVNIALKESCDVVQCGVRKIKENGQVEQLTHNNNNIYYGKKEILDAYFKDYISVTVWNKLYKFESVKNIRMIEGKNNEDNMYSIEVILNINKIVCIDNTFYNYLQRKNSIMKTSFNEKKLDAIYSAKYVINMCEKYAYGYSNYARIRLCLACYYLYNDLIKSKIEKKEKYKKIILNEFINSYILIKNREEIKFISNKDKFKIYSLVINYKLYNFVYYINKIIGKIKYKKLNYKD